MTARMNSPVVVFSGRQIKIFCLSLHPDYWKIIFIQCIMPF